MNDALKMKLIALGLAVEMVELLEKEGVVTELDITKLTDAEIKNISGCGLVTAKKIVEAFGVEEVTETALAAAGHRAMARVLPPLPENDHSALEMLKTGGVLKGEAIDVLAIVRASISTKVGIERIPAILLDEVEVFAERNDDPVPPTVFSALQKVVTTRAYAEVLAACGITGSHFMTEARKKKLLGKLDAEFWDGIASFQVKLEDWWRLWTEQTSSMGVAALVFKDDKKGRGDAFAEMIDAPDSRNLRAAAETVYNHLNKALAGLGVFVARALAYDITKTREVVSLEGLPAAVGCTNKEQLLKLIGSKLGVSIEADYVNLELNVAEYMLGIMHLKDVVPADESQYLIGLLKLGRDIEWEKLGCAGGATSGSGSFRG